MVKTSFFKVGWQSNSAVALACLRDGDQRLVGVTAFLRLGVNLSDEALHLPTKVESDDIVHAGQSANGGDHVEEKRPNAEHQESPQRHGAHQSEDDPFNPLQHRAWWYTVPSPRITTRGLTRWRCWVPLYVVRQKHFFPSSNLPTCNNLLEITSNLPHFLSVQSVFVWHNDVHATL